jgi:hypothetical protein
MQENSLYAKRCKAIREDSLFERQIPNMQFRSKTQKYEPLHNSQDEVSRQEDVPLQKDASYTNSIQKNFHIAKNSTSATQNKPIPSSTNKSLHPQAKEIDAGSKFCAYKILTIAESSVFLGIDICITIYMKKFLV